MKRQKGLCIFLVRELFYDLVISMVTDNDKGKACQEKG
jgi:hypothetical protein